MQVSLRYSTYKTILIRYLQYGYLCWQYNTEYNYFYLHAIQATYTTNNIILYLHYLLNIRLLTIVILYIDFEEGGVLLNKDLIKTNFQDCIE